MKTLVFLLLASITYLCDAGLTLYNSDGFPIFGSEESDEEIDVSCGIIMSPTGAAHMRPSKRITSGGVDAKYSEFPWMVALFAPLQYHTTCALTDGLSCWFVRCGGSLINLKVVLTTGYCVYDYRQSKLKVRAGDWNLDTLVEPLPYQERYVNKIITHDRYKHITQTSNAHLLEYDGALLVLDSPYTLADNIGLICLPPPDLSMVSTNCKAAGWGVATFMAFGYRKILQVIDVNYMDHDRCDATLRRVWSSNFMLHDSSTCAIGTADKGVCQGDGGSPLMCITDGHYYARGLSSWVIGCGTGKYPDVYADVVKMRNWVDEQMRANGFNTNTYTHA